MEKANLLLLCLTSTLLILQVQGQKVGDLSEEEFKELTAQGKTPLDVALRCGMFFAGEPGAQPLERMFVFNATWDAPECPTTEAAPRFVDFCSKLWTKILPGLKYTNKSIRKVNAANGKRIGDDICGLLLNKYKVPFVGRKQNSRRYPDGIKIGMYANACGNVDWIDTKLRHDDPICCIKGVYDPCA